MIDIIPSQGKSYQIEMLMVVKGTEIQTNIITRKSKVIHCTYRFGMNNEDQVYLLTKMDLGVM